MTTALLPLLLLLILRVQPLPGLPLCRGSEHVEGSWVAYANDSLPKKSFHCCSYDDNDYMHNNSVGGACFNPNWNYAYAFFDKVLVTGSDQYPTYVGEHGCLCDKSEGRDTLNPRETYYWKPSQCSLVTWNASRFCELLGKRRVLFVGDSTHAQVYATLTNMLHAANLPPSRACSHQLMFGRCNVLFFGLKGGKSLIEWVKIAEKPDIIIINAGAHLHDLGDIFSVQENLKFHFAQMKDYYGAANVTAIWKTQSPGHGGCNHLPRRPQLVVSNSTLDKYDWLLHPSFDAVAKNYSSIHGYRMLDMSPLYQRPDAHLINYWHEDCLHFCVPGPLDLFSILLLQMLTVGEV